MGLFENERIGTPLTRFGTFGIITDSFVGSFHYGTGKAYPVALKQMVDAGLFRGILSQEVIPNNRDINISKTVFNMSNEIHLNVLLLREPAGNKDVWVAQCLQYDIVAQGRTLKQAQRCFTKQLQCNIILALQRGIEPLSNLKPAPEMYWDLWNQASQDIDEDMPIYAPGDRIPKHLRDLSIPRGRASMRLAETV